MQAVQKLTNDNYSAVCRFLAADEMVFASIKEQYGFPPFWSRPPGFETLVRIILEQQVSLASGKAHFDRLSNHTGGLQPAILETMSDQDFRNCHISRQKMGYIRDLSHKLAHGELDLASMDKLDDNAVAEQLCRVKGIGRWTASIYLMMCLHRPDHFPPGDIAAINAAKALFPEMAALDQKAFLAATSRWAPFRTVATNYLWWWYLSSKNRKADF